jgi:hypothetical protein
VRSPPPVVAVGAAAHARLFHRRLDLSPVVSVITLIDGIPITLSDGFPVSVSRRL